MEQTVTVLSSLGLEDYCNDDGEVTDLFLTAQQFNKAAEARNAHREATGSAAAEKGEGQFGNPVRQRIAYQSRKNPEC